MNFREEFNLSIRARCAVLYVTTREEERLLSVVKDCAAELENMRVVSWDFASGFDVGVAVGKGNPIAVLDFIAKEPADTPILYVLKDFHRFLEDNMVCRMVKNLAAQLKPQQKSILIVSPVYKVPEELTSSVSVLEFQLPTLPELREYITNITQNVVVDMDKEGFEQFVRAFQGLTISTVKTILSKALARSGKITLNDLQDREALHQAILRCDILSNATRVGMAPYEDQSNITDLSWFRPDLIVTDVVYAPPQTRMLREAQAAGCLTCDGLGMLLCQGAEAFRLYSGMEMPVEEIRALLYA